MLESFHSFFFGRNKLNKFLNDFFSFKKMFRISQMTMLGRFIFFKNNNDTISEEYNSEITNIFRGWRTEEKWTTTGNHEKNCNKHDINMTILLYSLFYSSNIFITYSKYDLFRMPTLDLHKFWKSFQLNEHKLQSEDPIPSCIALLLS